MAKTSTTSAESLEIGTINLTRLLSSLERTILAPDADPELRRSSYERTRVGANLEYARSLLLRLEHDSASIKIQSRKQTIQADLQSKRDLIKRLNQRLSELVQLGDTTDDASVPDSASSEDEDVLPSYAPAVRGTSNSIDTEHGAQGNSALHGAAANLASTLRARRPNTADGAQAAAATATTTTTTTASSTTTGASLFPPSSAANPPLGASGLTLPQTETLLGHNRSEQENLTGSLLSVAQALKSQSLAFQSSLETSDKEALARAADGLDRSSSSMEAAGRRMGALRRMAEGRGWWGRMLMYAWIAGLWVLAFAIVFVLPKLRF